jgi:hypothetical protein
LQWRGGGPNVLHIIIAPFGDLELRFEDMKAWVVMEEKEYDIRRTDK